MKIFEFLAKANNNLDLVRLLLASMVLYGHAPCFIDATGQHDIFGKILQFTYSGNVAVITFFLISGLLVSNSLFTKKNWKLYLISRLFRLVPGLLLVLVCTSLICILFTNSKLDAYVIYSFKYIVGNIFFDFQPEISSVSFLHNNHPLNGRFAEVVNGSLWTISLEFNMYLLVLAIWFLTNIFKIYFTN